MTDDRIRFFYAQIRTNAAQGTFADARARKAR
jgi:hypothetical protein